MSFIPHPVFPTPASFLPRQLESLGLGACPRAAFRAHAREGTSPLARLLPLLGWLLSAWLLAGCSTFVDAKFNRGQGIAEDEGVLVVPFGEPGRNLWYGESPRGVTVAEAIKGWVRKNWTPNLPEDEETEKILKQVRDWTSRKISPQQWKALTSLSDIKYVVYGEIRSFATTHRDKIGIYEPHVEAFYRVVDVSLQKPRVVYQPQQALVIDSIEEQDQLDMPIMESGRQEEVVERKVLAKLGVQIGKDLYGYYQD